MSTVWTKSSWTDASQVLGFIGSAIEHDSASAALSVIPHLYFQSLVDTGKSRDAVYFVSHALPRYECVVWAVQALLNAAAIERDHPLVIAILRWIDDPDDDLRRTVKDLADAEDSGSALHMLGMAVFMSGGSVSLPELPPVLAPADACAKYATGALLIAASESSDRSELLRRAAEIGHAMASQTV
jgi:hypothetical protein